MNKFLSHIEKKATIGEIARGVISPAWMQSHIAKEHGKETGRNMGQTFGDHMGGIARAGLRSEAEGLVGGGLGALVSGGHPGAAIAGAVIGGLHGTYKSLKNQANEAHDKYSDNEKKAALGQLLDSGYSFDEAAQAIEKEADIASAIKGTASVVAGKARAFGTAMKMDAGKVGAQMNTLKTGQGTLNGSRFKTPISSGARGMGARQLAGNKAVQVAAGAAAGGAAIGGAMASRQQEKQACLDKLLANGVNFDGAIALIKQAEQDVYKK